MEKALAKQLVAIDALQIPMKFLGIDLTHPKFLEQVLPLGECEIRNFGFCTDQPCYIIVMKQHRNLILRDLDVGFQIIRSCHKGEIERF